MAAEYDQDGGIVFGPRTIFGKALEKLDSMLFNKFATFDNFNEQQKAVIEKGKAMGIDTTPIENDTIPAHFMEVLLKGLEQGVNVVDKFGPHTACSVTELEIYIEAAVKGYDLTELDNCNRNIAKMRQVMQGFDEGLNVSLYTSCLINTLQAEVIMEALRAGMSESFVESLFFCNQDPEKAREWLRAKLAEKEQLEAPRSGSGSAIDFLDTIDE